jgi:hypothetical protein
VLLLPGVLLFPGVELLGVTSSGAHTPLTQGASAVQTPKS